MLPQSLEGACAGLAATVPMTLFMEAARGELPLHERYSLPPRQITSVVGRTADVWHNISESQKKLLTGAAHFSYGGAMGGLYQAVTPRRHRSAWTGAAFGMAVWGGSYLGLLPALGILRPATQHPAHRNALMIAAHLIWGASLGYLLESRGEDPSR
jgi:uncharacterized membrane protein YagU involved in acid resistance